MNAKKSSKKTQATDLSIAMTAIIAQLRQAGKHSAVHTYASTLNSFTEFSGGKGTAMPTNKVFTSGRLKEYQDWLLKKGLSWNSISTYLRTLRAVYNRIFPIGSKEYDPKLFEGLHTTVESYTKRALTEKQMQKLLAANPNELPEELQPALAYFLLMFLFRGMPFIDLAHLRKRDVRGSVIVYCRHKTGKQITVRIPKEAAQLIKKYQSKNPDSLYLFPILNNELKDDWELHNYYLGALHNFNKQLKKLAVRLLPGVSISSYTARHTWATLAYHLGTPVGIICTALGHSSIRVTETYLKPFDNERVDKANYRLITSVVKCKRRKPNICKIL